MIPFVKMHGIGNDFVLVDGTRTDLSGYDLHALARALCDRHLGVGADGLIVAARDPDGSLRMRMWNPDGSESEMCGNGVRCFLLFARENGLVDGDRAVVATGAGKLLLERLDERRVRVDMGPYRLTRGEIGMLGEPGERFLDEPVSVGGVTLPGSAVSMGNPHLVLFVEEVDAVPLDEWGPFLEHHPLFPERVNVHFVEVLTRGHLRQRTWERGAGATLACGTGACASAVAAWSTGRAERCVLVDLPGGRLEIEIGPDGRVFMTGPAEKVFVGEWPD